MGDETPAFPLDAIGGARRLPARAGYHALLWAPVAQALDPPARRALRATLGPVAEQTFDGTDAAFWEQWLSDASLDRLHAFLLVLDADDRPAAWVASERARYGGRPGFYASSAGAAPAHQGAGLTSFAWRVLIEHELRRAFPRRLQVAMRTGNPLVWCAWALAAGGDGFVEPRPAAAPSRRAQAVARDVAGALGQGERLDPRTLVIRDAYAATTGGLWRQRPTSSRPEIDDWLGGLLGRRDAIVLVAEFSAPRLALAGLRARLRRRRAGR